MRTARATDDSSLLFLRHFDGLPGVAQLHEGSHYYEVKMHYFAAGAGLSRDMRRRHQRSLLVEDVAGFSLISRCEHGYFR